MYEYRYRHKYTNTPTHAHLHVHGQDLEAVRVRVDEREDRDAERQLQLAQEEARRDVGLPLGGHDDAGVGVVEAVLREAHEGRVLLDEEHEERVRPQVGHLCGG